MWLLENVSSAPLVKHLLVEFRMAISTQEGRIKAPGRKDKGLHVMEQQGIEDC
jgi:hypothetical protein